MFVQDLLYYGIPQSYSRNQIAEHERLVTQGGDKDEGTSNRPARYGTSSHSLRGIYGTRDQDRIGETPVLFGAEEQADGKINRASDGETRERFPERRRRTPLTARGWSPRG